MASWSRHLSSFLEKNWAKEKEKEEKEEKEEEEKNISPWQDKQTNNNKER